MCPLLRLIIAPQEPMPDEICLDPIAMALSIADNKLGYFASLITLAHRDVRWVR